MPAIVRDRRVERADSGTLRGPSAMLRRLLRAVQTTCQHLDRVHGDDRHGPGVADASPYIDLPLRVAWHRASRRRGGGDQLPRRAYFVDALMARTRWRATANGRANAALETLVLALLVGGAGLWLLHACQRADDVLDLATFLGVTCETTRCCSNRRRRRTSSSAASAPCRRCSAGRR